MYDDNVFEEEVMPDAGDMAEIEIYKLFRKWRASAKQPRVTDAFRSGFLAGKAASPSAGPICKICGLADKASDAHYGIARPFGTPPHKFEAAPTVPSQTNTIEATVTPKHLVVGGQKNGISITDRERITSQESNQQSGSSENGITDVSELQKEGRIQGPSPRPVHSRTDMSVLQVREKSKHVTAGQSNTPLPDQDLLKCADELIGMWGDPESMDLTGKQLERLRNKINEYEELKRANTGGQAQGTWHNGRPLCPQGHGRMFRKEGWECPECPETYPRGGGQAPIEKWISVSERMPNELENGRRWVEVYDKVWDSMYYATWSGDEWNPTDDREMGEITHWQPLPEPPKETK